MQTVRENILENIRTTLEGVAGIKSVQRWDKRGNPLRQVPCIVVASGQEQKTPAPNPMFTCHLTVYLDVWIRQDSADTGATDSILSALLGDIEKAVITDGTRGGYAKDTVLHGSVPFESVEGQPHAGLVIEIEVIYQHKQDDPEVAG